MVKRVKDMTVDPRDVGTSNTDPNKLAQEVEDTTQIARLSEEAHEKAVSARRSPPLIKRKVSVCPICEQNIPDSKLRYYNVALLKKYMSLRGRILPRSKTGLCAKHHRMIVRAIKRARQIGLLPYIHTGAE